MTTKLGPAVCTKLRTKTMYLNVEYRSDAEEELGIGNSAVYWCLKTHECLGPDNMPVKPSDCGGERACAQLIPEV